MNSRASSRCSGQVLPQPRPISGGPVVLIGLGVLFLLNTLELVRLRDILRFWPVFLIGIGAYMLYVRAAGGPRRRSADGPGGADK